MKSTSTLLMAALALTGATGSLCAQPAQSTAPFEVAALPYIEIFSPTFFWNDEADFVRTGSTTCPRGPRDHRRLEHPAGQGVAADSGELSGWRILGGARRQPAKAGKCTFLAGARLRAVPAAGGPQGIGLDGAANQAAACVDQVQFARGLYQHGRPPSLPARLARDLGRIRARPGIPGSGVAAAGAELSRSERLERQGGQRHGRIGAGSGRARLCGLPRH